MTNVSLNEPAGDSTPDDPGAEHFAALATEYGQWGLRELAIGIDRNLVAIGRLLNDSQPPMSGKLGLRWWLKDGMRQPVVVEWRQNKSGRFWPERIEPTHLAIRAKGRGAFGVCRRETVELLEMIQKLIAMRKSLREGARKIRATVHGLRHEHLPVVSFQDGRCTDLADAIHAKMSGAGYYDAEDA